MLDGSGDRHRRELRHVLGDEVEAPSRAERSQNDSIRFRIVGQPNRVDKRRRETPWNAGGRRYAALPPGAPSSLAVL
jgi:hypothetical protein